MLPCSVCKRYRPRDTFLAIVRVPPYRWQWYASTMWGYFFWFTDRPAWNPPSGEQLRRQSSLAAISDFNFSFRQGDTPFPAAVQTQITVPSFERLQGSVWLFRSLFWSASPLQPAPLLTSVPTGWHLSQLAFISTSLRDRQEQRRDHPQHASEQPPSQMPPRPTAALPSLS